MDMSKAIEMLTLLHESTLQAIEVGAVLDMQTYGTLADDVYVDAENSQNVEAAVDCGTVCCLLGWGAYYPPLQEKGLVQRSLDGYMDLTMEGRSANIIYKAPSFFGITGEESEILFSSEVNLKLRHSIADETTPTLTGMLRVVEYYLDQYKVEELNENIQG